MPCKTSEKGREDLQLPISVTFNSTVVLPRTFHTVPTKELFRDVSGFHGSLASSRNASSERAFQVGPHFKRLQ